MVVCLMVRVFQYDGLSPFYLKKFFNVAILSAV